MEINKYNCKYLEGKIFSSFVFKVHIIIHDCTGWHSLSNYCRLFEVVTARKKCLMNGGLILPGDISIYLCGLDPDECQTDEIEGKWTFPFPADYKFLGAKVGKKNSTRLLFYFSNYNAI